MSRVLCTLLTLSLLRAQCTMYRAESPMYEDEDDALCKLSRQSERLLIKRNYRR